MPALKNIKWENFAVARFSGMSQKDAAIEAGYSFKTAGVAASRLAATEAIQDRIQELNKQTVDEAMKSKAAVNDSIMSVRERKELLTEIARARLSDFIEIKEDGSMGKVDIKAGHSAALQEVTVTEFKGGKNQRAKEISTKLKLYDPVRAIAELNRMEGEYPPSNVLRLPGQGDNERELVLDGVLGRLRGLGSGIPNQNN